MAAKKYLVLVGDGMADWPLEALEGRTPLEVARTPWMDALARKATVGLTRTVPNGLPPDSSIANLSLLGYDPRVAYPGRGPLEAAAQGIKLDEGDLAFRCNLVTLSPDGSRMLDYSAGHISTEEAREVFRTLQAELGGEGLAFYPGVSFRGILVARGLQGPLKTTPPHDIMGKEVEGYLPQGEGGEVLRGLMERARRILAAHPVNLRRAQEGKSPANGIWPWGEGRRPRLEPFQRRFGLKGSVVAGVDLIKGIGILLGLEPIFVPGATGWIDTDMRGKAKAGLEALERGDFLYLHVEAPDEAAHMGSLEEKVRAIERFDREVVGTILEGLRERGWRFRMLLATDHPTPLALRTHVPEPVPFLLYDSEGEGEGVEGFCEREAAKGVFIPEAHALINLLLEDP